MNENVVPTTGDHVRLGTPDGPFAARVRAVVQRWVAAGRGPDELVTGVEYFMLQCWDSSSSAAHDPVSRHPDTEQFRQACWAANGGLNGWHAILRERLHCSRCYETYRGENMQVCLGCGSYCCYRCAAHHDREYCQVVG